MSTNLIAVILAAGKGTRMMSPLPKPMLAVGGKPMLGHVLTAASALDPGETHVVIGPDMGIIERYVGPVPCTVQHERLGTGHALQVAMENVRAATGTLLVLNGDVPLITPATLTKFLDAHAAAEHAVSVLAFTAEQPGGYGRMVVDGAKLVAIVEAKDATPVEKEITLCNGGIYAIDLETARSLLPKLSNANAAGEYYITDVVSLAIAAGKTCGYAIAAEAELSGANNVAELAELDRLVRASIVNTRQAA